MIGAEFDMESPVLQKDLEEMAAGVTPMPEEFRQGWRRAVRAAAAGAASGKTIMNTVSKEETVGTAVSGRTENEEAARKSGSGSDMGVQSMPSVRRNRRTGIGVDRSDAEERTPKETEPIDIREGTGAEKRKDKPKPRRMSRGLRTALSFAAMLVFLVGGTFLTRDKLNPKTVQIRTYTTAPSTAASTAANSRSELSESSKKEIVREEAAPLEEEGAGTNLRSFSVTDKDSGIVPFPESESRAVSGSGDQTAAGEESAPRQSAATVRVTSRSVPQSGGFMEELTAFLMDMGLFVRLILPFLLGAAALAAVYVMLRKPKRT